MEKGLNRGRDNGKERADGRTFYKYDKQIDSIEGVRVAGLCVTTNRT